MSNPNAPQRWTIIRGVKQLVTVHGEAGARRGREFGRLEVIPNAAVLLRNNIIESVGPANRIENLSGAKKATEIAAGGKVLLPAFVEPDGVALHSGSECIPNLPRAMRTSSRKKLTWVGLGNSAEYARNGTLTTGVAACFGEDLRTALKLLQTIRAIQGKPLRIRTIFSAPVENSEGGYRDSSFFEELVEKWLPAVKQRRLASTVEIPSPHDVDREGGDPDLLESRIKQVRHLALSAANLQFALRIRAQRSCPTEVLELAATAGATTLLTHPRAKLLDAPALLRSNTVIAFPATLDHFDDRHRALGVDPSSVRPLIEAGAALALCMGPANENNFTRNMQHTLHVACSHFRMTAEEAITAATINAACALRTAHTTGSIEPGKSADLVLMDVPDYRDLVRKPGMCNVEVAMRAGQVIYRRPGLILD